MSQEFCFPRRSLAKFSPKLNPFPFCLACVALKITQEKADSKNSLNNSSSKFRGRIKEKFIVTHKLPRHRLPDQKSLRFSSTKMRINLFEKKNFCQTNLWKGEEAFSTPCSQYAFCRQTPSSREKIISKGAKRRKENLWNFPPSKLPRREK